MALTAVTAAVSSATAQELEWSKRAGGVGDDIASSIAVDGPGNSYVGGFFEGTATFGEGEVNETELEAVGGVDIFVAKYDRHGVLVWAKRAGGSFADEVLGIATDSRGNSYVTGFFAGTATFGEGEANETELSAVGFRDIFIAKYDRNGNLLWATRVGGDEGFGIAIDASGNSYVIGGFSGTATFGEGEANEIVLSSAGAIDIVVAKYDRNGRLLWARGAGGTNVEQGLGIATDGRGNSYVTGYFFGTATFGEGEANETELSTAGSGDTFVAKYDRNGLLLWAKQAGGSSSDRGVGISTDAPGNSYVTGHFDGTATFGEGEDAETNLSAAAGGSDIFVAKYDRDGLLVWAKQAGGIGGDTGTGIATDSAGKSYVTGSFGSTATFGEGEAHETELSTAGSGDTFVAEYDRNGLLVWAKQAGGTGQDDGVGIATDGRGNSYVTGSFRGTATFGESEVNETELEAVGGVDIFVAKYDR